MMITEGVIGGAQKVVVYGPEGIGKTTFAGMFPDPVFCDTEGSTRRYNLRRTPKPASWKELLDQVAYFLQHPDQLGTFVLDTADWAEKLCVEYLCTSGGVNSIEGFGYGKGYVLLQEEFGRLLDMLSALIDKNVHVVLTAHAQMRKFEQPDEMGAYDRWEMKLSKKVAPIVKEWADMVLFANYKTYVINTDGQGASKGKNKVQGGKRVMYTSHNPCWDAKNREGLPDEMDFDYTQIWQLFPERPKAAHPVEVPADQLRMLPLKDDDALEAMSERENISSEAPAPVTPDKTKGEKEKPVSAPPEVIHVESSNSANRPPNGIPEQLWQLMLPDQIKEEEVMLAVEEAGYFPRTTPIRDLPRDYIDGVLIGAWQQVRAAIMKNRDDCPF